jgi:bifunctional non-homologous end joining protein LigD
MLYAFDLLYLDGHDLLRMELTERRKLLESLIPPGGDGAIRLSEEVEADGQIFFDLACEHGLEGIVAKRRDRPYRAGRTGDWLKIKCVLRDSFIVVGYEAGSHGDISKLLLAGRKGQDALVYVGSVGTGFSGATSRRLRGVLDQIKVKEPPVAMRSATGLVFAQRTLIVEVEYRAWTEDGMLRHPSYKGLSNHQDNAAIYRVDNP